MRAGYLSEFFAGVAIKTLRAVEVHPGRSNQHEFNGNRDLVRLFGRATQRRVLPARFICLTDDDPPLVENGSLTWYDARENHPIRTEHRLYFAGSFVSDQATEGDLLVLALQRDGSVLVIIAPEGSTAASQVQWLFNTRPTLYDGFLIRDDLETERDRIEYASRFILEQIGIEVPSNGANYLEDMLRKFGTSFPKTREFSAYARSTLTGIDVKANPDAALMAWMEREETLFRVFEKHLISERLARGFADDVDGFLQFSLSVQNRRKSRVGLALENHLETLLKALDLRFDRTATTEARARPDFLFPGARAYHDSTFDPARLTMLGVKSTCKDRWRQVLAEAARIERKHLLTLETAVSRNQLQEMQSQLLQLVVPQKLHDTYTPETKASLIDIQQFVTLVKDRELPLIGTHPASEAVRAQIE